MANKHEQRLSITSHQRNANRIHKELAAHHCQNGYYPRQKVTNADEEVEKVESLHTVGANLN